MRLRLGRTARLVLVIGVFVIILGTLFMVYFGQAGEQEELEKSLAGAQTQLTKAISGRESLESQLSQQQSKLAGAQALLSSARASLPEVGASIEYDEVLSELAEDYNLEVVSMKAEKPREKEVEDITFFTISFEVEVRGEVNSILSMVNDIATDERFASATVEVVDIKVPELEPIVMVGEEREEPSATIKLIGYSYGGE
jgi:hypothetical protein